MCDCWTTNLRRKDRGGHLRSISGILVGQVSFSVIVVSWLDGDLRLEKGSKTHLLVGLVSTDRLASVKVAVDAGVGLVQEVGLVRSGSVGCRSWAGACETGVVCTMGTGRVVCALSTSETGVVCTMGTGCVVCAVSAGDSSASDSRARGSTVVAVRVNSGVGLVGDTAGVGTVSTGWVIVTGCCVVCAANS